MQQTEQAMGWGGAERTRVEAVVETLATLRSAGESLAEVAHDARNIVTALGLYCDLLEEPGVLASPFRHYGSELRLVATASRRLVEKLVALDSHETPGRGASGQRSLGVSYTNNAAMVPLNRPRRWDLMPAEPIENLGAELMANCNLLAALAGPSNPLTMDAVGCDSPVRLTGEDLTRILVNLIKNAAEAMPAGGPIKIGLRQRPARNGSQDGSSAWVTLTVEDSGQGIPSVALDRIFESGYTTRDTRAALDGGWPAYHRGLGLSITRSIIEAAGGRIHAANRPGTGARFEIELPVRTR